MTAIDELVKLLKKLPGMGEKSATRLAYHLIATDNNYNKALGESISSLQEKIHPCPICGCYSEGEKCPYCDDEKRDHSIICVVEQPQDTLSIAQSGVYNGLFHVLGGAINPINGIGPGSLRLKELKERVEKGDFKEVNEMIEIHNSISPVKSGVLSKVKKYISVFSKSNLFVI